MRLTAIVLVAVALSGCATKRYGRLMPLSAEERSVYTCRDIALEQSKVQVFEDELVRGSQFNGASALGVLGDFGIGNAQEKNAAQKSAMERRANLRALAIEKGCDTAFSPAGPATRAP